MGCNENAVDPGEAQFESSVVVQTPVSHKPVGPSLAASSHSIKNCACLTESNRGQRRTWETQRAPGIGKSNEAVPLNVIFRRCNSLA